MWIHTAKGYTKTKFLTLNLTPRKQKNKKKSSKIKEKRSLSFILLRPCFKSSIAHQAVPPPHTGEADQYDFQGDVFRKNTTSKPPVTAPPKSRSKVCTWKIKDLARSLPTNASKEVNDI
jgi:hypothetical protein